MGRQKILISKLSIFIMFVAFVFVIFSFQRCSSGSDELAGKWKTDDGSISFEFFKDGKVIRELDGHLKTGEYTKISSGSIKMTFPGDIFPFSRSWWISGNELTFAAPNQPNLILKRIE